MNSSKQGKTDLLSRILIAGLLCLGFSALLGCYLETTKWEEDRGIPFSPDDQAIAYRHRGAVYVARSQGDELRRIFVAESDTVLSTPHWAPGQRAVVFAVSNGKRAAENGLLNYELWLWPAPEAIWTSENRASGRDTVTLPTTWTPAIPRKLASAHCRAKMQIEADALFSWHPDGERLLFLDADNSGAHSVVSLNVNSGERTPASPIRATSLAFSISPRGDHLASVVAGPEPAALWVGPIGADKTSWKMIESNPGPRLVPELVVEAAPSGGGTSILYDLRPRLGVWSPDSEFLAHVRIPPKKADAGDESAGERKLVVTPIAEGEPQRIVSILGDEMTDLHWAPSSLQLGLRSDKKLLLVSSETGAIVELSGVLDVEQFIGWSEPGNHIAYLTLAEEFDGTQVTLPTGDLVVWAPALRHNVMIAQADGTHPKGRFRQMNISSARWGNLSPKLSFWATHLPTVSYLPPGDPAAVLDLERDAISWYPTDLAEYAQVGHYYLLNEQFDQAEEHYTNALKKLSNRDKQRVLEARIRMWRAITRIAQGERGEAAEDLSFFREHIVPPRAGDQPPVRGDEPIWDETVLRNLSADRILLSTMISMRQMRLAVEEVGVITEQDGDARHIQALVFLGLIDLGTAHHELFTENVVQRLIPRTLASKQVPEQLVDPLIADWLNKVLDPTNQKYLSNRSKKRFAANLVELGESIHESNPENALLLSKSAAIFYREAGATALEIELLRASADI